MVVVMKIICWLMRQINRLFYLASVLLSSCSIEPDIDKLPVIQPTLGFSIYQESITLNDVDIFSGDSSITKELYNG